MPGFDGTGPLGQGPMTGGGRGYCAIPVNRFSDHWFGRRFYCGRGSGRGWRNRFYATGLPFWMRRPGFGNANYPVPAGGELSMLKEQAVCLKEELETIQSRIQELEAKQEEVK